MNEVLSAAFDACLAAVDTLHACIQAGNLSEAEALTLALRGGIYVLGSLRRDGLSEEQAEEIGELLGIGTI